MSTFPSFFKFSNFSLSNGLKNYASDSKGLKRNTRKKPAQRWEFTLDLFLKSEETEEGFAFLNGLDINVSTFEIDLTSLFPVSAVTQLQVLSPATVGSTLIGIVSSTNIRVGQFFKFNNHSKVYQVRSKPNANQIEIYPALRYPVGAANVADFANYKFTAYIVTEFPTLNKTFRNSNTTLTLGFVEYQ